MAFFNSKKPIISAVGHEIDFLLSDLTADKRAATPTQAIELAVPEKDGILFYFEEQKKYLNRLLKTYVENMRKELEKRSNDYHIKKFPDRINSLREEIILREKGY